MIEIPTNSRQRDAIRIAHEERARVFADIFDAIRHPLRSR